jgi:hypothetical protein
MFKKIILATTLSVASSTLFAACESNVDSIQTLYINGMFTNEAAALSNKNAIDQFIARNLSGSKEILNMYIMIRNGSWPRH